MKKSTFIAAAAVTLAGTYAVINSQTWNDLVTRPEQDQNFVYFACAKPASGKMPSGFPETRTYSLGDTLEHHYWFHYHCVVNDISLTCKKAQDVERKPVETATGFKAERPQGCTMRYRTLSSSTVYDFDDYPSSYKYTAEALDKTAMMWDKLK